MSIELDMWLILKQANQDFISKFRERTFSWELHFKAIPNSKDFYALAIEEETRKLLFKTRILAVTGLNRNKFIIGPTEEINKVRDFNKYDFNNKISNWLENMKLQIPYGHTMIKEPEDDIEFSKEEIELFGDVPYFLETIKNRLQIGQGIHRTVFDLGDFVLKVVNTQSSIEDARKVNKDEADPALHSLFPNLTVKTYKHAPDYSWIIQDKVLKIASEKEVKSFFGMPYNEDIQNYVDGVREFIKPKEVPDLNSPDIDYDLFQFKKLNDNLQQLVLMVMRFRISDLRNENFGVIKKDGKKQIVLIDIGTHEGRWENASNK